MNRLCTCSVTDTSRVHSLFSFVRFRYNDATGAAVTKCSTADMAAVVPTLPGPPTCLGISNPTRESLDVDALLPFPDNGDAVTVQGYAFQCLDSSEAACDPDGPWFPSSTPFASNPTTPVTVSGLAAATDYNCWAATVVGDSAPFTYYCSDPGEAGTLPFYPPSVTAASGDVGSQVAVTGTAASPPNGGTNLKVACVAQGDDCPDVLALGWVAVGTSGTAEQVAKLSDGSADLVGGTTYTCYSIEVDANDSSINKCSGPVDVIAALNMPTVSAVTGLIGGAVSVTATAAAPSNQDTELKIACVADGGTCPTATGTTWNTVPTSGSPQEVQTLADGSSMVAGTAYTCYSAEISTTDSNYRVCSLKSDVTAKTLNAPSVTAASGFVPNQVAVTGAAPAAGNVGTTLKVACVVQSGECPDFGALGWVAVGTSGTAEASGQALRRVHRSGYRHHVHMLVGRVRCHQSRVLDDRSRRQYSAPVLQGRQRCHHPLPDRRCGSHWRGRRHHVHQARQDWSRGAHQWGLGGKSFKADHVLHVRRDDHGVYVRRMCFCPPVAPAALPPHRFVYVLDVSTLTGHGHSSLDVLL